MPYTVNSRRNARKARKIINIRQTKFPKGYVSTIDNSRRPIDSLSDMTNIEVVQDSIVRPRPPLVRYGTQPANTVIGRMNVRYSGTRKQFFMQNVASVGKLYSQTDGGSFTLLGGTYDDEAWAMGVQAKDKVYIFNGVDKLSYVKLSDNSINTYTTLATPVISSVVYTGTAATTTHYYRVSANNAVGESIASAVVSDNLAKDRNSWVENTDYMDITWGAVAGASSYTIYYSSNNIDFYELYSVNSTSLTFRDLGTIALNIFKLAPEGNSTDGPIFRWMYVDSKNSQVFGIATDNKFYYSAPGATTASTSADFSPFNGGGFVTIDEGSDTYLNFIDGFRTGKGDPVVTVSARGAAGKGKLFHVSFETLTVGDQTIVYPFVIEANGQASTYAPRATIKERDALWYPTGTDFKSTGTSQNIVNILTTNNVSQVINDVDIPRLSLNSLDKAVGVSYMDKLYFALPVGATENNEIWYLDLARKNLWVLRWPIAAKEMWLYEDNNGTTHHCVLVDNIVLEFTRAGGQTHQDDETAWSSRVAFESMVWDESGIILGSIRNQYFKFLFPKGIIQVNAVGLTRKGVQQSVGSDTFTVETTPTGYDLWVYDEHVYDEDPGTIDTFGKRVAVLRIKPRGLLAELSWEVVSETSGTDYLLSTVTTKGYALDDLVLKA